MGTGASDVERRVEKIDKKLTKGNRESHKLTKLYKKYKKFTNIMKKLGSFMKFWTKKVLMGIINSVYAIMYDTRVKKEKMDAAYEEMGDWNIAADSIREKLGLE